MKAELSPSSEEGKEKSALLFNLAELQNECSRRFKISPDETLRVVQELYERKLVTYPRTDARVLSTAVAKEIGRNLGGLKAYGKLSAFAAEVLAGTAWKGIGKTRYVNDKQITDHYAIIPTGQGLGALKSLPPLSSKSMSSSPAVSWEFSIRLRNTRRYSWDGGEGRALLLRLPGASRGRLSAGAAPSPPTNPKEEGRGRGRKTWAWTRNFWSFSRASEGSGHRDFGLSHPRGETSPPKRYNSGSIILAMENAGQLIEDEELRAQIKGSGIGTSATRAEILKKLVNIKYLALNKKTPDHHAHPSGRDDLRRGAGLHLQPPQPGADSQLGEGPDPDGRGHHHRRALHHAELEKFITDKTTNVLTQITGGPCAPASTRRRDFIRRERAPAAPAGKPEGAASEKKQGKTEKNEEKEQKKK